MQKKIIALAVASALTMPAWALAEVTAYGQLNMAYEMTDTGSATAGTGTTAAKRNQVSSNVSRLGFKGSEDLGNGMSVVFQMEGEVMADTGAQSLFTRNTFAGVAGGFGTVVLGRHDTPYKMATRKLDVFADSIADNRSIMGGGHDARLSDVAAYISPSFNGLTIAAAMVGQKDNTLGAAGSTVKSATSISGNYARDNYTASLAMQTVSAKDKLVAANEGDLTATKLGGSYAMDAFTVGLAYEMLTNKVGGGKADNNNLYLAGTYKTSDAGKVKLAYTSASGTKTSAGTAKDGATQLSLGYDHSLTKNTTVFALYSSIANDVAGTRGFTSGGSTGDTGAAGTADDDMTALAIGVRHAF